MLKVFSKWDLVKVNTVHNVHEEEVMHTQLLGAEQVLYLQIENVSKPKVLLFKVRSKSLGLLSGHFGPLAIASAVHYIFYFSVNAAWFLPWKMRPKKSVYIAHAM